MGARPVVVSVIFAPEFLEVGKTGKEGVAWTVDRRGAFKSTKGVDYAGNYWSEDVTAGDLRGAAVVIVVAGRDGYHFVVHRCTR